MKNLLYILLVFFFCFSTTALSQNPQWISYTNGDEINEIEMEGEFIWVGTNGGLVKVDTLSGNAIFLII